MSPPGTGKIPVDSDGFGCWAEGTQALSLPVPALPPPLVTCTDPQPQSYVNIWSVGGKAYSLAAQIILKYISYHFGIAILQSEDTCSAKTKSEDPLCPPYLSLYCLTIKSAMDPLQDHSLLT